MISDLTKYLWATLDQDEKVALAPRPESLGSLRSRRETLQRFKDQWSEEGDWQKAYLEWLPTDEAGRHTIQERPLIGTQIAGAIHKTGLDKLAAAYVKKNRETLRLRKKGEAAERHPQKIKRNDQEGLRGSHGSAPILL